jgi:hypothetical protein
MKNIIPLLIVILLVGCNSFTSTGTFSNPVGYVICDDESYPMAIGNFEWEEDDFSASSIGNTDPVVLADQFETLEVSKGELLVVEVEMNPNFIQIKQIKENGTSEFVDLQNNEFTVPEEEGYFIYEVEARWKQGKSTYVFDVDVK